MQRLAENFRVFRAAPDLLDGLAEVDPRAAATALRYGLADLVRVPRGIWDTAGVPVDGVLALLVVKGMLLRDLRTAESDGAHLVGPGDLVRPWEPAGKSSIPCTIRWTALVDTEMAVLDRRFAHTVGRWPEVADRLLERLLRRTNSLALQLTLTRMPRLDQRLYVLLWHLADRWGAAGDGADVQIHLPLSHEALGRLVGATRPAVSRQLRTLQDTGVMTRDGRGTWTLFGPPVPPSEWRSRSQAPDAVDRQTR